MKRFLIFIFCILMPTFILAQEEAKDDRSFLTALIEDNLSGTGHDIKITGFKGALSSRATIEELTIADANGVWLTLRGAVLDWNRAALLRGRLEVNALSAQEILLPRLPESAPSTPRAEAGGAFSLPDLPVALQIKKVNAAKVVLGAPILGQDLQVHMKASAMLDGGVGDVVLEIARIDGAIGTLSLAAAYSNVSRLLGLNVSIAEGGGGIVAKQMGLPGAPELSLRIAGEGPIDNYHADIALATDGTERLAGVVDIVAEVSNDDTQAQPVGYGFTVDIGGDIAPLFAADYRNFFGTDIRLKLRGSKGKLGDLDIDQLSFTAQSMTVEGRAKIGAQGQPEYFDLTANVNDPLRKPVLLPFPGVRTEVSNATLSLSYDRLKGDAWGAKFRISGLSRPDIAIAKLMLSGQGNIEHAANNAVGGVKGVFDYFAEDIVAKDQNLARAIGDRVSGRTRFNWQNGVPLEISELSLSGLDFGLKAKARIKNPTTTMDVSGAAAIEAEDLSRFADLVGRPLGGAAKISVSGQGALLSGAFDLVVSGTTQDLAIGQPEADVVLKGDGNLSIEIVRNVSGLTLKILDLATDALTAKAQGQLSSTTGSVKLAAELRNAAILVPGLTGALSLDATAKRNGSNWQTDISASGPAGLTVDITGNIAADGTKANVSAIGVVPLALANPFITPRAVQGNGQFDLRLKGPIRLDALSGVFSTAGARLSEPTLGVALNNIAAKAQLGAGSVTLDVDAALSSGGRVRLDGPLTIAKPYSAKLVLELMQAVLTDPSLYKTTVNGQVTITGSLTGGALIAGKLALGETEIQVPSTGLSGGALLPDLIHLNEPTAVRRTRGHAGLLQQASSGGSARTAYPIDLTIDAPGRMFIRGRGLDAEMGGVLKLGGNTAGVVPAGQFDLIRGRLDILGKRLTLEEGLVQLQGDFEPYIRMVATSQTDTTLVRVEVEGEAENPEIRFSSVPALPEDEVLAQLLFGRSATKISPFQAAQLAAAVAELAGRKGGGIVSRLRAKTGFDDLDVTTNASGGREVRAGKYISENIYSEVTIDSDGTSVVNLNLDVNRSLTVRGGVESTGDTSLGIFFERDY
ncbi:MAG: translocation/assembly module TamB domain-containing protein [Amylibacter sp.]